MGATTTEKLWAMASHTTTNDNEAGNAFVMFRRSLSKCGGVEPYLLTVFGKTNNLAESQMRDAYESLRKRHTLAENVHSEKIKQIEKDHQKALEQVLCRVREAEEAFAAKEAELADFKASGGNDELGLVAQRNSEIEALAVQLKSTKEAVQQLTISRDQHAADKVAAAERAIMDKIFLIFGKPVEWETQPKAAQMPVSPKPAGSSTKKPNASRPRARQASRKGADTESIVSSLLTNEWKSVSTLFNSARRYGFTGVENAIRFAAERLVRAGNAEQGYDHRCHIAFRRA